MRGIHRKITQHRTRNIQGQALNSNYRINRLSLNVSVRCSCLRGYVLCLRSLCGRTAILGISCEYLLAIRQYPGPCIDRTGPVFRKEAFDG